LKSINGNQVWKTVPFYKDSTGKQQIIDYKDRFLSITVCKNMGKTTEQLCYSVRNADDSVEESCNPIGLAFSCTKIDIILL
jgi:hypothetical protein